MLQNQHYWTKLYNTEFVQHLMLKSEFKQWMDLYRKVLTNTDNQ